MVMPNLSLNANNLRLYKKIKNFEEFVLIKNSNLRRVLKNLHLECKHPTPMTIQLHPQCLLGIQGILRNWTFLIFKQV